MVRSRRMIDAVVSWVLFGVSSSTNADLVKEYKWAGGEPIPDGGITCVQIDVPDDPELPYIVDLDVDFIISH